MRESDDVFIIYLVLSLSLTLLYNKRDDDDEHYWGASSFCRRRRRDAAKARLENLLPRLHNFKHKLRENVENDVILEIIIIRYLFIYTWGLWGWEMEKNITRRKTKISSKKNEARRRWGKREFTAKENTSIITPLKNVETTEKFSSLLVSRVKMIHLK